MAKSTWKHIENALKEQNYFKSPRNNDLVLEYIIAKKNGFYENIAFAYACESDRTFSRIVMSLKKIARYIKKDFDKYDVDDIVSFRNALNSDEIKKSKTIVKWNDTVNSDGIVKKEITHNVMETDEPVSHRTKLSYKNNFSEFWRFLTEYMYQKEQRKLPDVTRYFTIQKPADFSPVKVEFIPLDDLLTLCRNINNRDFRSFIQLAVESGARPCEILNLKFGNNLYKNDKNEWVINLPKIKRVSYKKFPTKINKMFGDDLYPYLDTLVKSKKEGEKVFTFTEASFRKLMKHYTTRILGKYYSPKVLRKTTRMILTNSKYGHDHINKILGHAPGSGVQDYYTNYEGLEDDEDGNERLKGKQYPSLNRDYTELKMKMEAEQQKSQEQEKKLSEMQKQLEQILKKQQEVNMRETQIQERIMNVGFNSSSHSDMREAMYQILKNEPELLAKLKEIKEISEAI